VELLEQKGIAAIRVDDEKSGKTITLCNECLKQLNRKLYTEADRVNQFKHLKKGAKLDTPLPLKITPKYIYTLISHHVVGQERAKKAISLAVATHLRRLEDPRIEKSNILLMGPTGSGKTELARSVAKILNLPLAITDATTLTAHGYVGEDVETILFQLLQEAKGDLALAERGIVFIDEFDKLALTGELGTINTSAVQQSLLKMLEGGKIKVPKGGTKRGSEEFVLMDTSKILFICAGAFSGLEQILDQERRGGMGINSAPVPGETQTFHEVNSKHLTKFGIIPEILGRLPVVTATEKLSVDTLVNILTVPKNSLTHQYQTLLSSYGVKLEFTPNFLTAVAQEALASGIGARGLRSVMERRLSEALFEGPDLAAPKKIIAEATGLIFNPVSEEMVVAISYPPIQMPAAEVVSLTPVKRGRKKKNPQRMDEG
jgi:ATP-dependent Clp protease ATP-binding subunit ClpX